MACAATNSAPSAPPSSSHQGTSRARTARTIETMPERAPGMTRLQNPVATLYSFAKAGFWPEGGAVPALLARLEADGCDMVASPRQANGQSYGNLFWSVMKT